MIGHRRTASSGQAMVELALVFPLFITVLCGIVILGLGVFYQQQVTNAAREGARYASVHSATARCPTTSNEAPNAPPDTYAPTCDPPTLRWPKMHEAARGYIVGIPPGEVHLSACWAGYVDPGIDAPPADLLTGTPNPFAPCTIGGIDPKASPDDISCPAPLTTAADDTASSMSASYGLMSNEVTVYVCYVWRPPLAGFLLIPSEVTLRGVVTEKLEYQQ
jgi:hypothetical protein